MSVVSTTVRPSSSNLLDDETTLLLLRSLVSGESVSVNINALARLVKKHRNTIRNEVLQLLERKVVNPPVCPFMGLYREYPLLVVVRADLPYEKPIYDWVARDKHIFAAYWSRHAEYNRSSSYTTAMSWHTNSGERRLPKNARYRREKRGFHLVPFMFPTS